MLRGDDMTVAVTLEVFADLCSVSYLVFLPYVVSGRFFYFCILASY